MTSRSQIPPNHIRGRRGASGNPRRDRDSERPYYYQESTRPIADDWSRADRERMFHPYICEKKETSNRKMHRCKVQLHSPLKHKNTVRTIFMRNEDNRLTSLIEKIVF